MHTLLNPYTLILWMVGLFNLYLVARLTQHRRYAAARLMGLVQLAAAIWAFSYANELASTTLLGKLIWASLAYLGTSIIGPLYVLAIAHYLYPSFNLKKNHVRLLWGLFIGVNLLVWTNSLHHLVWTRFELQPWQKLIMLIRVPGPLYYIFSGYTYLSMALSLYLLLNAWNKVPLQRRQRLGWVIAAVIIPSTLSILAPLASRAARINLNLTPFSSAFAGLALTWAMFRYTLEPILLIARDTVLDAMRDGTIVLDRKGYIVDLNQAAEAILNVRLAEARGVELTALLAKREDLIQRRSRDGGQLAEILVPGPQNRIYEVHITPIKRHREELVGQLILLRDVTEQRRAEAEAMAQRHYLEQQNLQLLKLSRAIEQSANAVVITDTEGRIEYVNPSFTAMTGYAPEEIYGKNPRILKSGVHAVEMYRHLWDTITSGHVWRGEFQNRRKDGSLYWDRSTIAPIFDAEQRITHFVAIKEDVTALKMAEEERQRYLQRLNLLREITESMIAAQSSQTIATATVNRLWRLIPCDRALVFEVRENQRPRLLAAQANAPLLPSIVNETLPLYQELHTDVRLRRGLTQGHENLELVPNLTAFQRALLDEGIQGYVIIPLMAEGRLIGSLHLHTLAPRAFTQEHLMTAQEIAATLGIAIYQAQLYERAQQEINERKQAQARLQVYAKELEARNSELDTFAHMVAHDLKNPINAILGYGEMLLEDAGPHCTDMQRDMLQEIVHSAGRMTSIIEELLVLSSLHHIKEIGQTELDMALIVAEVQGRLRYMIETAHATINVPETWPRAMGYSAWVEEIWANYISNAIKYGGQPPQVTLGATDLGNGWIRFWVKDNGPGIAPEDHVRLFVPFTRMDQIRARGHGLGLSIVRQIVERMGGEVGVESEPGAGATFYFTLRAAASAQDTVIYPIPR